MAEFIKDGFEGRKICILGFGREGQSTYHFIRKHFPGLPLAIADQNAIGPRSYSFLEKDENLIFVTGADYLDRLDEFDLIFKTPGITMQTLNGRISEEKITSQADIFLKHFGQQVIGVTGTKGKSTTASLLEHMISNSHNQGILVGNIGLPPLDFLDEINKDTIIIYELSSHQLETIRHSPHIAILLNLFEEHLDHYRNFMEYALAKFNIIRYQDEQDFAVINADDAFLSELIADHGIMSQTIGFSGKRLLKQGCYIDGSDIRYELNGYSGVFEGVMNLDLKGRHNLYNVMAAVCAARLAGLDDAEIDKGMVSFKGLKHRIEYLGAFAGIDYYNDSISTVPQATIEAIKTLGEVNFLILGGFDRGIDYEYLVNYLSGLNIDHILFMGPAGKRMMSIFSTLNYKPHLQQVESLKDAVAFVKMHGKNGDTCLLSPAAASYDSFRNFEERGEMFENYARIE